MTGFSSLFPILQPGLWMANTSVLPHVNASLNLLATILLLTGFVLIKARRERAHRIVMLSAFAVSCVFLVCYLVYHFQHGRTDFPRAQYPSIAPWYLGMLASHIILAALVPFLAIATIVAGLRDRRVAHRRLAKVTFPVWLYVSVTGVLVYLVLYWWCVPTAPAAT